MSEETPVSSESIPMINTSNIVSNSEETPVSVSIPMINTSNIVPKFISKFRYTVTPERLHSSNLNIRTFSTASPLPTSVDLRPNCPPVYDQGSLGSCTANALVAAYQYDDKNFMGSRLFLYYNERAETASTNTDSGSTLSIGINALSNYGIPAETTWPYITTQFAVKPPATAYTEALNHKVITATNLAVDINQMKACLASGLPFVVAIQIYSSFEGALEMLTGNIPMPSPTDTLIGGHAIMVVGYNDSNSTWICRNSWGSGVMDKGYFYLPYLYLTEANLASDIWQISVVTPEPTPLPPPPPPPTSCSCSIS